VCGWNAPKEQSVLMREAVNPAGDSGMVMAAGNSSDGTGGSRGYRRNRAVEGRQPPSERRTGIPEVQIPAPASETVPREGETARECASSNTGCTGHPGKGKKWPTHIDRTMDTLPDRCHRCGGKNVTLYADSFREYYVEDSEIRIVTICYRVHYGYCPVFKEAEFGNDAPGKSFPAVVSARMPAPSPDISGIWVSLTGKQKRYSRISLD